MSADRTLRADVYVDGVRYHAGSVPPVDVAKGITAGNAWVQVEQPDLSPEQGRKVEQVEQPEQDGASPAEGDQFDPSKHSVADVRAYLDGADDAERERVLEAERSGKGRSTLIG